MFNNPSQIVALILTATFSFGITTITESGKYHRTGQSQLLLAAAVPIIIKELERMLLFHTPSRV
jgi:hypothetical protein